MIHGINQQSDIFAQIHADIVAAAQGLRTLVNGVRGQDTVDQTFLHRLIEDAHALREQAEACAHEYLAGLASLQLLRNIDNAVA